ncbi:hypothetical protein [Kitasatospora sp. NPDC058046]|uniref:hypothetical protein n=1 Tax=Kitasatospora sp. NPDC058046 TaxID=3346312 RepID=UPI0036D76094
MRDADNTSQDLLHPINATGDLLLSGADVDGRYVLRMFLLNQRLRSEHLDQALAVVHAAAQDVRSRAPPLPADPSR